MTSILKNKDKLNNSAVYKVGLILLWAILILWRIPFINKGIDYTDTGFSLTNYQNVFNGVGIQDIGTFLTRLIGGLVYYAAPASQLLVMRILYWILCVGIDAVAFLVFRKKIHPCAVLAILIVYDFASFGGEALLSYYPLTKILLLSAIALLLTGIEKDKSILIFLSGLLCGINVFIRLPNALFCMMFVGVIAYGVWTKQEKKEIAIRTLQYILGAVLGAVLVLIVVIIFMGFDGVINSFMEYVNLALGRTSSQTVNTLGIEEASGHSVFAIIKTVGRQVIFAFRDMALFGVPMLMIAWLSSLLIKKDNQYLKLISAVLCVVAEIVFIFAFRARLRATIGNISAILMMAMCLFMVFALKGKQPLHRALYLIAFLIGGCCLFGSDLGLSRVNMLQGIVPLTIVLGIMDIKKELLSEEDHKAVFVYRHVLQSGAAILLAVMAVTGVTAGMKTAYMDGDYAELNTGVNENISVLKGMKTTDNRAREINEYYDIMSSKELADTEVAIFGYFPLGYVIGPQKDYFESVQPCVDYPAVSVVSLLEVIEQKKSEKNYPIIVLSHVNKLQRGDDHDTSEAKLAVMNYMLTLTDYQVFVDDDYYLIYVPKEIAS